MSGPRRGGGFRRETCHLGHPITGEGSGRRRCKTCTNVSARARRRREYDPALRRKHLLHEKYGLTPEAFSRLLVEQDGLCAICYVEPATCVDHDHETGRVRGLLCRKCNLGIGHLRDDTGIVSAALDYLAGAA